MKILKSRLCAPAGQRKPRLLAGTDCLFAGRVDAHAPSSVAPDSNFALRHFRLNRLAASPTASDLPATTPIWSYRASQPRKATSVSSSPSRACKASRSSAVLGDVLAKSPSLASACSAATRWSLKVTKVELVSPATMIVLDADKILAVLARAGEGPSRNRLLVAELRLMTTGAYPCAWRAHG